MVRWIPDTAFVDPTAQVADGCHIGPFCQIASRVELKSDVTLGEHVWVGSRTLIDRGSQVASHALLGASKSQAGSSKSALIKVGKDVRIGRAVVIEPGCSTVPTVVGDRCVINSLAKIESSALLGQDVHLGFGAIISHRCVLQDHVNVGHGTVVQSGTRLGRNCATGSLNLVIDDVPPHMIADGRPARVRCVNIAGLHRLNVEPTAISALVEAHRLIYKLGMSCDKAETQLRSMACWTAEVMEVIEFLRASAETTRGYCRNQGRVA